MQAKLTIQVDKDLIERVKIYSDKTGKSVSQIVADYFILLDKDIEENTTSLTPIVSSLRGYLRKAEIREDNYRQYLEDKYLVVGQIR
jgi:hypothetical protein